MSDNPYAASADFDGYTVDDSPRMPGVVEILGNAFQILTSRFALFSMIILTVWLPGNLFINYLIYHSDASDGLMVRAPMMIEGIFGPIYIGALVFAVAQHLRGNTPTYSDAIGRGFAVWGQLFAARFVAGLLVTLGLILLIIPGVILAVRYALLESAVVLENEGTNGSRQRSIELTAGIRWQIFGTAMIFYLVFAVISFSVYLPLELAGELNNMWTATAVDCFIDITNGIIQIAMVLYFWHAVRAREDEPAIDPEAPEPAFGS